MAKAVKKKKKKKKSAASNTAALNKSGMVSSKFIKKLEETFAPANAGVTFWTTVFSPPGDTHRNAKIRDDLGDSLRLLFQAREVTSPADLVPIPGSPGSATELMVAVLAATGWPKNPAQYPVPSAWKHDAAVFRRYEIACAINILLRAYNTLGSGGSVTWPPHKPGRP